MRKFISKNGAKVATNGFLLPWWLRKIYKILREKLSMATASIVPAGGTSDHVVSFQSKEI